MLTPKPVTVKRIAATMMSRRWTTLPHITGRKTARATIGLSTRNPVTSFIAIATGRDCRTSEGARVGVGGRVWSKVAMCRSSDLRILLAGAVVVLQPGAALPGGGHVA